MDFFSQSHLFSHVFSNTIQMILALATVVFSAMARAIDAATYKPLFAALKSATHPSPATSLSVEQEETLHSRFISTVSVTEALGISIVIYNSSSFGRIFGFTESGRLMLAIVALFVVVACNVLGTAIASSYPRELIPFAAKSVSILYYCLIPFTYPINSLQRRLQKTVSDNAIGKPSITEEDLEYLVSVGEKAGVLEETKREMIAGVFEFDETRVREIMTPRTDIQAINVESSLEDATKFVLESGHSRLPVYNENFDNIVGIILAKDLLRESILNPHNDHSKLNFKNLIRKPLLIPESKLLTDVFKELKRSKNHMAVIVDEFGGTAGIVTLEDILEEIVGEIQDEHDTEEAKITELEPGVYKVVGSLNIDEFLEAFHLDKDKNALDETEDTDTLAGFLVKKLGTVPEVGKKCQLSSLDIEISKVDRQRIQLVRVTSQKPQ